MDKNKIMKLVKENSKRLIIIAIGIVLSIVLQAIGDGGTLDGLGILLTMATIVYTAVSVYKIINEIKKEKEEQAAAEEKAKAEKAIEDFKANFDADAEIDYIFSVVKGQPTLKTFEQGIQNLINKNDITVDASIVRSMLMETLMKRVVTGNLAADDPAAVMIAVYFAREMEKVLAHDYVMIAQADMHIKNASSSTEVQVWSNGSKENRVSFVKNLYGFAVRVWNYASCLESGKEYAPVNDKFLANLIKNDEVIKSYCEGNPFEADEKKAEWLADLRKSAYSATNTSDLQFDVEGNEKTLDMLCYMGYRSLTNKNGKETVVIAADLLETIRPRCEELVQRVR